MTPTDGWTFSVSGGPESINVSVKQNGGSYYDPYWTLDLQPPAGQDLGPGAFLDSFTEYYNSGSDAALSFRKSNSGYYTGFTGEFSILEFDVNVDGSVRRLSVDFTERYNAATQTTIGKFRDNSSPIVSKFDGLSVMPESYSLTSENHKTPWELREMHVKLSGKTTHHVLFRIQCETIEVLAVRHVSSDSVRSDDLA